MFRKEELVLHFVAFVVIPITVESRICLSPKPTDTGTVCTWEPDTWEKKFNLETKEYYYILKEEDSRDNFIERKARKRYIKKIKSANTSKNPRQDT